MTDDETFIAEMLQHLGHSTVKQVVEEALREYVGDGESADALVLDTFVREVAAKAWDEGFEAGWAECDDPGAFVNDVWDAKTPNPYREEGTS